MRTRSLLALLGQLYQLGEFIVNHTNQLRILASPALGKISVFGRVLGGHIRITYLQSKRQTLIAFEQFALFVAFQTENFK